MAQRQVEVLGTFDSELFADSVEFCLEAGFERHVAIGTYQLDAASGARHGRCYMGQITHENKLSISSRIDCDGILDMKWSRANQSRGQLCLALATGALQFYPVDPKFGTQNTIQVATQHETDKTVMCLSCDWHFTKPTIAVSMSDGCVAVCDVLSGSVTSQWKAHGFEAWVAAFSRSGAIVMSGGDDCVFRGVDAREPTTSVFSNSREHTAGVCTISASPHDDNLVVTGCYDDTVRVWDLRNMRRSVNSIGDLGGGVWRARWHPSVPGRLLCACMRGGFFVLEHVTLGHEPSPTILAHHDQGSPESVAYGCDWSLDPSLADLVVTASFYDHRVDTWTFTSSLPSR